MSNISDKAISTVSSFSNSGFDLAVITTGDQVNLIRSFWDSVQTHPNVDIDSFLVSLKYLCDVLSPYILLLSFSGTPVSLLIGRIEESRIEYKLGFKVLRGQKIRQLVVVYQGLLGEASSSVATYFLTEINHLLKRREIDAVFFYALAVESNLYRAANVAGNFFTRDHGTKLAQHWRTHLPPEGLDVFLHPLSSKHRYWLRRLPRVLEKDFPGRVVYRRVTNPEDVEQLATDCEIVASRTYHRTAGVGFSDNELWRAKLQLWAQKGVLQGHVLYINGQPSAFWLATIYAKTLHLDFTGYLAEYKKYEIGTILFLKMIDDAIAAGANELDYGLGTLWYKERFGGQSWAEASLYLFAPTFKGITANMTRWAFSGAAALAKSILNGIGVTSILMSKWRNRLSARSAAGSK
jgi:hypothetical protein